MSQLIAGRYQIEEQIGAGGMGVVYRAIDIRTQQPVAVKALNAARIDTEQVERFRREGEALRDLNHPNITRLLDTIVDENQHYLVMEYISGGDLNRLLQTGSLPVTKILSLAIDLADALTRAHKLNIIHRDLKPGNILIDGDGTLRLSDFGIAYISGYTRVTPSNALVGTVNYLAPETLQGEPVDGHVDIWAFGVMLFEMLTGQHPFGDNSPALMMMNILTGTPSDLEKLRPDAPPSLVDLVYRMLARDPQERIASVRLVAAELESILHGRSIRFDSRTPSVSTRRRHNLPAPITPFVGRESELDDLVGLLADPAVRLVTLVAPGGMGKTRLSLEAAAKQLDHFEQGVYLVELASLTDPDSLIPSIGAAAGYQFQSGERDMHQQLLDYLREKQMLLVLDNFEHLVSAAAIVTDILSAAPGVNVLATSRQPLYLPGETLFYLTGMEFPEVDDTEVARRYASVQLFINSGRRAQPNFELTSANLSIIARICRLVEGMPLGIVLAASWLVLLSTEDIADEIQRGLDFLEAPDTVIMNRQRSIRAVFDYTWQMLTADEQQIFMKLSVFRGGFTRQAAQVVSGASLRVLMSLVNKSLLQRNTTNGRYSIHELLRQYAEVHLNRSSEAEIVQDAASVFFLGELHRRHDELSGPNAITFLNEIRADHENISRAALRAAEYAQFNALDEGLYTLWLYHMTSGEFAVGDGLFTQVVRLVNKQDHSPQQHHSLVTALIFLSNIVYMTDTGNRLKTLLTDIDTQAIDASLPDPLQGYLLNLHGLIFEREGKSIQARSLYEQALSLFRRARDRLGELRALKNIASTYWGSPEETADWQRCGDCYKQIYNIEKASGNVTDIVWTLNGLGVVAQNLESSPELAEHWYRESMRCAEKTGNPSTIATILGNLGLTLTISGKFSEGLLLYKRRDEILRERGAVTRIIYVRNNDIAAHLSLGQFQDAWHLAQDNLQLMRSIDDPVSYRESLYQHVKVAIAMGNFESAQLWINRYLEGELPNTANMIRLNACIARLELAGFQGQWESMQRLATQAKQLVEAMGNAVFLRRYHTVMAWNEYRRGDMLLAENNAQLSVEYSRAHNYLLQQDVLQKGLAVLSISLSGQGRCDEAHDCNLELLEIAWKSKDVQMMAEAALANVELYLGQGKIEKAVKLAAVLHMDERVVYYYRQDALRTLLKCQTQLAEPDYQTAFEAGKLLKVETVIDELRTEFS